MNEKFTRHTLISNYWPISAENQTKRQNLENNKWKSYLMDGTREYDRDFDWPGMGGPSSRF